MARRLLPLAAFLALVAGAVLLALRREPFDVTCYSSVDDEIARDLLARFTRETGLRVQVVTDTESSKTVGLANTLEEEARPGRRPRADVFWNNEPVWTERLAGKGVLEACDSPAAKGIPAAFRDPAGFWAANGLRARVLIVHEPGDAPRRPASFRDLADPAFRGKGGMARPTAGTCLSHMAALRAILGPADFDAWFRAAAANGTSFASGNGSMAREVGKGTRLFGFTDTDDFAGRKAAGDPVIRVLPDQGEGEVGTFVLPVTVSLVRGGPHPENARRLYDWLLSPAAEEALSASPYATIPVRPGTKPGPGVPGTDGFRAAKADWKAAVGNLDAVLDLTRAVIEGK